MKEIVGARIGTIITNDAHTIAAALEHNLVMDLLDRQRMQWMAAMDLGVHWEAMANSPTLFCINSAGDVVAPSAV